MLENIKAFVFDCDGTLWLGDKAINGAVEAISALEKWGYQILYLTNNSGKSQRHIVNKLYRLGFNMDADNVYCGSYALASYLAKEGFLCVYVIGTDYLISDIMSKGISVKNSVGVSAVVVGFDPYFSTEKIKTALRAIVGGGAKLIVANKDGYFPSGDGQISPGCGAMVGAIVGATGHEPDFITGKPNTFMLELLCQEHGLTPEEICVVGDMPKSDIAMARNFGCQSILFDPENIHNSFPGTRIKNLRDIISLLKKGGEI